MPPMCTAPASVASATIFSTCSGASLIPGISGAMRMPVGIQRRLSSPTASSRARGFGAQHLGDVDLDDDLLLEVAPRVHAEVLVRGPCEAVVAHDAVGDVVAGAGRDVVERQLHPQRLDRRHLRQCGGLERYAVDGPL